MPRPRTGSSISPMLAQRCLPSVCSSLAWAWSGVRYNDLNLLRGNFPSRRAAPTVVITNSTTTVLPDRPRVSARRAAAGRCIFRLHRFRLPATIAGRGQRLAHCDPEAVTDDVAGLVGFLKSVFAAAGE